MSLDRLFSDVEETVNRMNHVVIRTVIRKKQTAEDVLFIRSDRTRLVHKIADRRTIEDELFLAEHL